MSQSTHREPGLPDDLPPDDPALPGNLPPDDSEPVPEPPPEDPDDAGSMPRRPDPSDPRTIDLA
jgi:hypothetical protein